MVKVRLFGVGATIVFDATADGVSISGSDDAFTVAKGDVAILQVGRD